MLKKYWQLLYLFNIILFAAQENGYDNNTYCPVCGSGFTDAEGLTKHVWEQHGDLMGPKKRGRPKKLLTSVCILCVLSLT